jgi:hypothetical protein
MTAHRTLVVAFVLLLTTGLVARGSADEPRQFLIVMKLITTLPDGSEKVLAYPRLLILDGREGCLEVGDRLGPRKEIGLLEPLNVGTHLHAKVFQKNGQIFVDASVSRSSGSDDADGVSVMSTGVRVVKTVTDGKMTIVSAPGNCRCELLVHEWHSGEPFEIDSNGATTPTKTVATHVEMVGATVATSASASPK